MSSIVKLVCICALIGEAYCAAIPMWEYLSKEEKMSYLYSMFANQVEDFCEYSSMRNCNHELLKFGLNKLKDMPEDHLDTMDPYQRGAHTLIWDSMMEGHAMMSSSSGSNSNNKKPPRSTTTAKPNSYDDQSLYNQQDYQSEASAKIESVYYPTQNGKIYVYKYPAATYQLSSGPSQYYPTNNRLSTNDHERHYQPLTGPMVVKVHLDGTPVKEQSSLPHDEDLRQYMMSKVRLPNL